MPAWHLRPRSGPEVVDASVQLLKQNARPLLLLATVLTIPSVAFSVVNSLLFGDALETARTGARPTDVLSAVVVMLPVIVVVTMWFLVAFGALVGAASSAYVDGTPINPVEAIRRAWPRAGVLLGAGLLTYLLVLVQLIGVVLAFTTAFGLLAGAIGLMARGIGGNTAGTMVVGIIGVGIMVVTFLSMLGAGAWLVARYVTLPAVAANEQLGVTATMRRARELSRGSLRRLTVLLLLVGAIFMVVVFGGTMLLAMVLGSPTAASVLATIVNIPVYAFGAVLVAVLYYDLRIRHEGLDIELLARELDAEPTMAEGARP